MWGGVCVCPVMWLCESRLTSWAILQGQDAPHNSWGGQQTVAPPSEPVPDGMLRRRQAANPREQAGNSATGDLSFD